MRNLKANLLELIRRTSAELPDDVFRAVVFLIENDYVTGETLVVDGGRRIR